MKSKNGTLSAGVETELAFVHPNADYVVVHITSGTGPIFFTVDDTAITSATQENTYICQLAGDRARTVQIKSAGSDPIKVRLFSATADGYFVEVTQ